MPVTVLIAFAGIVGLATLNPGLPISRAMHRWLVAKPASFIADFSWLRAVAMLLGIAAVIPMVTLLPAEIAVLALAGDVALYYEAVLIASILGAQMRARDMLQAIRRAPRRIMRSLRFARLTVRRHAGRAHRRLRAAWRAFSSGDEDGPFALPVRAFAPAYA